MICKKCNKEIENDNINFCPFCGEKLEDKNNQAEDNKEKDNNVSLVKKIKKIPVYPCFVGYTGIFYGLRSFYCVVSVDCVTAVV